MILSIDVGLRNLAMCVISCKDQRDISTYSIKLWDVFNTLEEEEYKCQSKMKNGKICGKRCLFKYPLQNQFNQNAQDGRNVYTCKVHFPKGMEIKANNKCKTKKINDYLLQDIAKVVLKKIQDIYDENKNIFNEITQILIELQPKINQKMKFTSHIIYGKLVELFYEKKTTIRFVRATNKLKAYTGPIIECKLRGLYAKRKWLSIEYTKWFLENKFNKDEKDTWLNKFLSHSKKDDMGDTLLMTINGLYGIIKKQITDKNGRCIK